MPEALLAENPDEVHMGGDNLRAARQHAAARGHAGRGDQRVPRRPCRDVAAIHEIAAEYGARAAVSTHFSDGGRGAAELAEAVRDAAAEDSSFRVLYPDDAPLKDKIHAVATQVYGADGVEYSATADRQLRTYTDAGFGNLPVCIAKTHLSISSDPTLKGAPTGWTLPVREVRASVGAGFVYPICGDMRTMPGLGRHPAAHAIDIDADGNVINLS
ncbi:MAG: formate--tetrahydrofolate ligase [Acidimicrobiales bacterium]